MSIDTDSSLETLKLKLSLHRDLLTLVKGVRPEQEVVEVVVDAVWRHFPDHRVTYSEVDPEDCVSVLYSRQPESMILLDGISERALGSPLYLKKLRAGVTMAIADIKEEPSLAAALGEILSTVGSISRMDCPVDIGEGKIGVLSLTYPKKRQWLASEQETVCEVAELIQLIFRNAQAQEKLKHNEAIFRQFAEHIHSVFWMSDPENKEIIYVSPAYDEIWGRSREEFKINARAFVDSIAPEDRQMVMDSFQHHHRGPFEKNYRVLRPDGSVRWIKDRSYPVKDESGTVYRVVGIAEDFTQLREAQEKLESTQAQVISNAKFAALGEMASSIAHEINNPLAVIQGISVQLQEVCKSQKNGDELFLGSLGTIEKMSKRISLIIKGLRTFSRQTDWDPMLPAEMVALLQETLAICEPSIHAENISLLRRFPSGKVIVKCRSSEISQVILNLLRNAIDAVTNSDDKKISVSLEQLSDGYIRIAVEDSGCGIDADLRERIFQPFFTTKEVGRGTGLGLSISKTIVEAHGGRLYLDSAASGTRFVIELPVEHK